MSLTLLSKLFDIMYYVNVEILTTLIQLITLTMKTIAFAWVTDLIPTTYPHPSIHIKNTDSSSILSKQSSAIGTSQHTYHSDHQGGISLSSDDTWGQFVDLSEEQSSRIRSS